MNTLPSFCMFAKKWPKINEKNKNGRNFGPKGHERSMKKGSQGQKKYI